MGKVVSKAKFHLPDRNMFLRDTQHSDCRDMATFKIHWSYIFSLFGKENRIRVLRDVPDVWG